MCLLCESTVLEEDVLSLNKNKILSKELKRVIFLSTAVEDLTKKATSDISVSRDDLIKKDFFDQAFTLTPCSDIIKKYPFLEINEYVGFKDEIFNLLKNVNTFELSQHDKGLLYNLSSQFVKEDKISFEFLMNLKQEEEDLFSEKIRESKENYQNKIKDIKDIKEKEEKEKLEEENKNIEIDTPLFLSRKIKEYVKGQDEYVHNLAMTGYQQLLKKQGRLKSKHKVNTLILGDSGTGKTHLVRSFAKVLDLPYKIIPCTAVTSSGWVGGDISSFITDLYSEKNGRYGIVFFDEFDKISSATGDKQINSHQKLLQNELLTIIEGEKNSDYDTSEMLFIFGGSFHEFLGEKKKNIGFEQNLEEKVYEGKITKSDVVKMGFKVELIGRIQNILHLNSLTKSDMYDILNAKEGFLDYYTQYFKNCGVDIIYDRSFLTHIIEEQQQDAEFGVRALNDKLYESLMSLMELSTTIKGNASYTVTDSNFVNPSLSDFSFDQQDDLFEDKDTEEKNKTVVKEHTKKKKKREK